MAHCNIYAANHRVLLENRYVPKKKVLASCKALAIRVDLDSTIFCGPNWSTAELTGGAATAAEQSLRRIALRGALRFEKWLSSLSRSLL
jgi:hypothetical protein